MSAPDIHLLLVEDDKGLIKSLARGFAEHGFAVACAGNVAEASRFIVERQPHVVILDLGLPDGEGLELIRLLRERAPAIPIIITTARGDLSQRVEGLEIGADDYLVKPFAFAELLARVRALLRRTRGRPSETLRVGDLEIDTVGRRVTRGGQPLDLTPRECDLLVRLARAEGGVVTRQMLAREVWRQSAWTASLGNAMDVHMSRLRDKIDAGRTASLLQTVRGVGYMLKESL